MNPNYRSFLIWGIIALLLITLFSFFNGNSQQAGTGEITYSDFLKRVDNKEIKTVTIQGQRLTGITTDNRTVLSFAPNDPGLVDRLESKNVNVRAQPESTGNSTFMNLLFSLLPVVILIGVWIFFMRQMQGGSRGAMGFGKSKAKLLTEAHGRVTFKDVAGVDEAKQDLQEIVEFLREPQKFQRLGGRIPRGVLLVGPPGTGKTLLARSVAGEANVPFFTISGSDFVEMFVGVGASRVRDMFEQAKKNAPCIIFIDEIDAVGRHRGAGFGGGNDEREQTLNQLLVEMDGFEPNESIILIAATNRPDVLDPALLRPGRFDRQVVVPNPDVAGREEILKVHVRNVPLAPNVDLKIVARGTPGFSGADLMNLVNEAALMAARRDKRLVTMQEFEDAKDKVMMGAERHSAMTPAEKELTAFHEAGHAIIAINMPAADPVHKATIVPRGRALGMVMQLPEGDKYSMSYRYMISRLAIMMGGRVAEELKFGKDNITSGASSDIEQATKLARAMVTRWGFSDELGKVTYGESQEDMYQGGGRNQQVSEETARVIDSEIRRLIDEAYQTAKQTLTSKKKQWVALAEGLLEYETLTGAEIQEVINGKPPSRDMGKDSPTPHVSSVPKAGKTPEKPKTDQSKSVVVRAKAASQPADEADKKSETSEKPEIEKKTTEKKAAEKKPKRTRKATKTSPSQKSEKPVTESKKSAKEETVTDHGDDKKA
ncbi:MULTISPECIES: ATP-dependent zinc metalloprotease FtsH [Bartonella]|uniref:ATP-dependent zinc metalloprotease FtsH n=1 Tax=Bartonella TaxID=773 RepID=UPI0018DE9CBF|nr:MULTISPECIES: ATP-dependent zinc metalloprotease FtsH [Bartonella]MBH9975069.1 ATP-dependent metallopeptidase FtsH/Yme1/Tma family protein [Bartonella choladocola]MBI0014675.1 ATP-dependent metallopeptidase FtsH/Yme1/Tma family protein [Bartonella sp. B10834G3]